MAISPGYGRTTRGGVRKVETGERRRNEWGRKSRDGRMEMERVEKEEWRRKSGEGTRSKEKRGRTEVLGIGKKANNIKINT